ncbi:hypothetical protein [Streptomyces subrutilus]|uniref:hypothetical protein n=1 Tax=Streptomyces subrutilus TaxID=36818 RepID=UPI002E11F3EA|nr:hypothetical protein OG479_27810 [Streptomyces subrutilus]
MSAEYVAAIKASALMLHGTSVVVTLIGGTMLTGTLAYTAYAPNGPYTTNPWPHTLTVTVSTKVHTVRLDHISAIGQG